LTIEFARGIRDERTRAKDYPAESLRYLLSARRSTRFYFKRSEMTRQEIQELEQKRKDLKLLLEDDKLSNQDFLAISIRVFGLEGRIRKAYIALEGTVKKRKLNEL